jgi:hypothetical protein
MAINYDSGGFIIGERRAKEIADGVNQTNDTTKQILDFLKNTMTELKATAEERAKANKSDLNRQNRHGRSVDASGREAGAIRQVVDASESLARATERVRSATQGLGTESSGRSGGVSGTRGVQSKHGSVILRGVSLVLGVQKKAVHSLISLARPRTSCQVMAVSMFQG